MKALILFILFITGSVVFAQKPDSISRIQNARSEAKKAKKGFLYAKQVRKHKLYPTSDYFKPDSSTVSYQSSLNDSLYIRTFRETSYQKAAKHRTLGHYALIAGGIYTGINFIIATVVLLSYAARGNL